MATYRFEAKIIGRSRGSSATASAAYRTAEKLTDERTGAVFDYTRRRGVLHTEILAPEGTPDWMRDRAQLWNAVEQVERRKDAQLARDLVLSLPHELTHEQRLELVRDFVRREFVSRGMIADIALHAPHRDGDERNFHAHVMLTMRALTGEGFGPKVRAWNDTEQLEAWREHWAEAVNRQLERYGHEARVDHRSLADQGLDREPEPKQGPVATEMEREGRASHAGDDRRDVQDRNRQRAAIEAELAVVTAQVIDLDAERAKRAQPEPDFGAALRTVDPVEVLEGLTARRATFTRAELDYVLAQTIIDPKARVAAAEAILARPEVVGLKESAEAPVTRYTTREVLAAERRLMRDAAVLAADHRHGLAERYRIRAQQGDLVLSGEQLAALRRATGSEGLALIVGEAGTGKSTTLAAIREAYERAGCRVVGMSGTNAVVQDMQHDGFRNATTVAAELLRLRHGSSVWDQRTVLMVDEAAMLCSRDLGAVLEHARAAGAKVVLAGDDKQLGSIERGGMFGALYAAHGAAELHEVYRVRGEQAQAFNLMHEGAFDAALAIFAGREAITWTKTQDEARAALVAHYARDSADAPEKVRFVFAYRNVDVAALNQDIRAVRQERGELGPDRRLASADGPALFAEGDRIQFTGSAPRRQDKLAGMINGGFGTIMAIDGDDVTVALDARKGAMPQVVTFTAGADREIGQFDQFRLGYAGTIYKGQGKTLDQTYLYHSAHWRSTSAYVALTRHRESVALFVATETARDQAELARQIGRIDDNRAASQFVTEPGIAAGGAPADFANERAKRTGQGAMDTLSVDEAAGRSGETPEPKQQDQPRRETARLQEMAQEEARLLTERRQAEPKAQAPEAAPAEQQVRRETEMLRQAAEVERRLAEFRAAKEREAEDALRRERERRTEEAARAQANDVSQAQSRYAQALGQHYDIRDPYASLARAAMAEYGAFHREQEQLRTEIGRTADPEQRKLLELRKEIEVNDYMAITSGRLAGMSRVITGRDDSAEALREQTRATAFAERARELRDERHQILAERARMAEAPSQAPRQEAQLGRPVERPIERDRRPEPERARTNDGLRGADGVVRRAPEPRRAEDRAQSRPAASKETVREAPKGEMTDAKAAQHDRLQRNLERPAGGQDRSHDHGRSGGKGGRTR